MVKMAEFFTPAHPPADPRQRLTELRNALQELHKSLLQSERLSYEASFGRSISSYDFLHLLTSDPWFAWLAPVTHLLAAIDTALDDARRPLTPDLVKSLANQTKSLLTPSEAGEGFARQYDEVLQRDPDVLFAHVAMSKLIRHQFGPPTAAD